MGGKDSIHVTPGFTYRVDVREHWNLDMDFILNTKFLLDIGLPTKVRTITFSMSISLKGPHDT